MVQVLTGCVTVLTSAVCCEQVASGGEHGKGQVAGKNGVPWPWERPCLSLDSSLPTLPHTRPTSFPISKQKVIAVLCQD